MTEEHKPAKPSTPPVEGVGVYDKAAGGWGALASVAGVLNRQEVVVAGAKTLLRANQPEGFDCPGCAWPDPKHTSSFEFCENGAKAVAWESTPKRTTPDFFAQHTVSELRGWSDHALEDFGRLTHPMVYDAATDKYVPIDWATAFERIGANLRALDDPNKAEFYASGRASNEAAFLFQLMGRAFGTNNFPDCSNMCHEPTSVALPPVIGMGKGSVSLDDFEACDAIFSFGHNPGTNHPRMMSTLRQAARRGCKIAVFNPFKERALERFTSPQSVVEMTTGGSTPIASHYYQVGVGGDGAALQGIMKAVLEADSADIAAGGPGVLDRDFIAEHTLGFDALRAELEALDWSTIEAASSLTRARLEEAARVYRQAKSVIVCYGMGITQHRSSSSVIQQIANLLLMRGNIGRAGAGICPVRGHSNVQGARTVGVAEKPSEALLASMDRVFGLQSPRAHGHTVVEMIAAARRGDVKALISLGGNLAAAAPDPEVTHAALQKLDLTVNIATKLNRSHLLFGRESYLLPCLGRTESDVQATGVQAVTVEDSMAMVHASRGTNTPASEHLMSEPAIIAGIAKATLGDHPVDWDWCVADYSRIRDLIEAVFPVDFADYNARVHQPGGFRLPLPHAERSWKTASGKAHFAPFKADGPEPRRGESSVFLLSSIRSHDQYNTTIDGNNDRYRGIFSRRDVVFISAEDQKMLDVKQGDKVDIVAAFTPEDNIERCVSGFTVVTKDIPAGSVAAYYPEVNRVIILEDHDQFSGTPAYKSAPVRIRKSR